ncbi:hypothetical protein Tco_0438996 [Tanacetum coccineum]
MEYAYEKVKFKAVLFSPIVQLTVSAVVPWKIDGESVLREACDKLVPLCRRAVVAWERSKTESWRIGLDGLKFIRIILAAALFPNIDGHDDVSKREGTATRVNLEESGVACDGSPKVSNSSPLISHTATINMPRRLYNVDVAATFEVPLTIVVNLHMLINGIESGKHDVLLSGMTNDERMAIMDALGTICNSIKADNTNADVIPCRFVDINTKSTSYAGAAGASAKDQPKFNSNFHPLVDDLVFDGVNISIPRKVVEKENWAKHGLKRIMMNSKGFFFFKFDSYASLEAVLEGGPCSMCNDSWGRSSFARCLIKVNSEADLVDVVTIGIPSLIGDGFTKETIRVKYEWRPPRCDICKIFGHCPNKVVSPPIVTTSNVVSPTFAGPSVKQNVRYEPKATTSAPKKGATNGGNPSTSSSMLKTSGTSSKKDNIPTSNSYSVLNAEEEEDEDVENVYDELANLSTKTSGRSYFMPAVS